MVEFKSIYWYPTLGRKYYKGAGIGKINARQKYYLESHKRRWEKSRNAKYPELTEPEIGIIGGIRWITA